MISLFFDLIKNIVKIFLFLLSVISCCEIKEFLSNYIKLKFSFEIYNNLFEKKKKNSINLLFFIFHIFSIIMPDFSKITSYEELMMHK